MPIAEVQFPDGRIGKLDVPEGTTPDQILKASEQIWNQISSQTTQQQPQPSQQVQQPQPQPTQTPAEQPSQDNTFLSRLGEDWNRRQQAIGTLAQRENAGDLNPFSGALQHVGQYGGFAGDVLGESIKSAYQAIPESVKDSAVGRGLGGLYRGELIPGFQSLTGMTTSPQKNLEAAGKLVGAGMEALRQYSPDAAANVEAVANIASVYPLTQTAGKTVSALGEKLAQAPAKQSFEVARSLVEPKPTITTKAEQIRTEQGWNRAQKVVDPRLDEIAQTVEPYVNKNKSLLWNENAIRQANINEAENLRTALRNDYEINRTVIPDIYTAYALRSAKQNLDNYVWLVGNNKKIAENAIIKAVDIIREQPRTPEGMLNARIAFDDWAKSQANVFDNAKNNPITAATTETRNAMNNLIASSVPNEDVMGSLRKQSNMYNAVDNIAQKRASVPSTRTERAFKNIQSAVTLKNAALAAAAAGGIGAGAAPVILPAAGAYGVYKAATSPMVQGILGKALKAPSKLVSAAENVIGGAAQQAPVINNFPGFKQFLMGLSPVLAKQIMENINSPEAQQAMANFNQGAQ